MCDLYWIWIYIISNKHPVDIWTQGTSCLSFPLLLLINDLGCQTSYNLIYLKSHYDNKFVIRTLSNLTGISTALYAMLDQRA